MKKILLPIIIILLATNAIAQHFVGVKGGYGWTLIDRNNKTQLVSSNAWVIGAEYRYQFKSGFYIGADALIDYRETKKDISKSAATDQHFTFNRFKYYSLPVFAGYRTSGRLSFSGNVGVVLGVLSSYKEDVPDMKIDNILLEGGKYDLTNLTNKVDFAGLAEIGASYRVTERVVLGLQYRFTHSFNDIAKPELRQDMGKHTTSIICVSVLYRL